MILYSKNQDPINSVLYISGCILTKLKEYEEVEISSLYNLLKHEYNKDLTYNKFILSLNLLFLCEKLILKEGNISYA